MLRILAFIFFHYRGPLLLLLFAAGLIAVRVFMTSSLFYTFLLLNLALAIIPYFITQGVHHYGFEKIYPPFKIPLFLIWFLFLPNSSYLITDLVHLHSLYSDWKWFDLFIVFVFAFAGLVFGTLSILDVQRFFMVYFGHRKTNALIFLVCLLVGYGVYLGRFLRFNSWDALIQPKKLFIQSVQSLGNINTWLMSLAFGIVTWLTFTLLKWIKEKS